MSAELSEEWRRSIAAGWRLMLPQMRRGIERLQQRLGAETDTVARYRLEGELVRRRDCLREAEATLARAEAPHSN